MELVQRKVSWSRHGASWAEVESLIEDESRKSRRSQHQEVGNSNRPLRCGQYSKRDSLANGSRAIDLPLRSMIITVNSDIYKPAF